MKLKILVSAIVSIIIWPASITAQSELIPMIEIPAGNFYMGTLGEDENYDEAPMHKVHISKSFKMGMTEVTNAQYELFCPEHKTLRGKNGFSSEDDEAVVYVTYQDAVAFCDWLTQKEGKTYRLPTEAEWEYACKAGRYWNFYMDDKLPVAWQKNQVITATPKPLSLKVAQTPPNDWGLYDMCGNVEEWCLDWYGPYIDKEQTDPVGYSDGIARVTRGGSHNTPVKYLRSANRMAMLPEDKHAMTGFRVVQAEYPQTAPLSQPKDEYVVSQIKWDWASQYITEPVFTAPLVYVHEPDAHSGTPFFKHNHQPALTWCDNGDLLAVWFSTNEEKGREMVVLSSRLRAGSSEWEKPRMFYQIADRNLTGTALLNDHQGTLYHINGVEAAGHWQNLMMTLRTSTDNGQTWSKPRIIAPEHTRRHQVIAGTSITKEGWFVQACDAGPGGRDGAAVHISKDKGKTWTDPWDGASLLFWHRGVLPSFGSSGSISRFRSSQCPDRPPLEVHPEFEKSRAIEIGFHIADVSQFLLSRLKKSYKCQNRKQAYEQKENQKYFLIHPVKAFLYRKHKAAHEDRHFYRLSFIQLSQVMIDDQSSFTSEQFV